jgi:membrane dipeptidase
MTALQAKFAGRKLTEAEVVQQTAERRAIAAKYPAPRANLDDLMKHIVHVINLVGVDHVGLCGDFDGGGGIDGFDSVADFPAVTQRLIDAGYSREDVAKVMGGNVLRVLRETEAYVAKSRASAAAPRP